MTTDSILRFSVPDFSVSASDRSFFAFAAPKKAVDQSIPLNDARISKKIVPGPAGLDVQGFAFINHKSALHASKEWFSGQNVEDVYLPEVCQLICDVTGAKRAIVNNVAFRRRLADEQDDPTFYLKKGCELDKEISLLPRDKTMVYGKQEAAGSLEPARPVHVDYTALGLARTARECRRDISEVARDVLDAEDAQAKGEDVKVPRYAAYSVWRPIKTVKRDPLAVCDYRTIPNGDLHKHEYRALSEQNASGEYTMEYWSVSAPADPKVPQWYWIPEQKEAEVLIIKFADTAAETDTDIARCCPHGAAVVPGTEGEEPRESIECRVLAFWD